MKAFATLLLLATLVPATHLHAQVGVGRPADAPSAPEPFSAMVSNRSAVVGAAVGGVAGGVLAYWKASDEYCRDVSINPGVFHKPNIACTPRTDSDRRISVGKGVVLGAAVGYWLGRLVGRDAPTNDWTLVERPDLTADLRVTGTTGGLGARVRLAF